MFLLKSALHLTLLLYCRKMSLYIHVFVAHFLVLPAHTPLPYQKNANNAPNIFVLYPTLIFGIIPISAGWCVSVTFGGRKIHEVRKVVMMYRLYMYNSYQGVKQCVYHRVFHVVCLKCYFCHIRTKPSSSLIHVCNW